MNDKKNIDRLFQEKFKDFEVTPPASVWQGIEEKLKEKKKERRIIPFWFKSAGIAAALLIGMLLADGAGMFGSQSEIQDTNSVVVEETPTLDAAKQNNATNPDGTQDAQSGGEKLLEPVEANGYQSGIASETDPDATSYEQSNSQNNTAGQRNFSLGTNKNKNIRGKNLYANPSVNKAVAASSSSKQRPAEKNNSNISANSPDYNIKENPVATENANQVAQSSQNKAGNGLAPTVNDDKNSTNPDDKKLLTNTIITGAADDKKTDSTAIATVVPNTLEELLNEKENKTVTADEPKLNRWQISSTVAPIYFSSTSNGSPIDARLAQNSKDYKADLTVGLGVRYAINNKFTVRAGVNTIGMEYYTNDLAFVQTANARTLKNVKPNVQGTLIHIESKKTGENMMAPEPVDTGRKFESSLSQRTGYIEVPVEMSYKLLDKKFGIELIGGVSTLFLNENSVSLISSGIDMEIGKANNLSATHFSTNLGVGFRYNFLRNFQFNVEPMFKYQINTFSHSSSFNPYIFGLYTGVNYRF